MIFFDHKTAKEALANIDFADRPIIFADFGIDELKKGGNAYLTIIISSTI